MIWPIFKNIFFYRHTSIGCFWIKKERSRNKVQSIYDQIPKSSSSSIKSKRSNESTFSSFVSLNARNSHLMCSVKKVFLKISQNSQKKTCTRVSFLIKLQASATLLKTRLWHRCFPVNFAKFIRTHFFKEHLMWLLL